MKTPKNPYEGAASCVGSEEPTSTIAVNLLGRNQYLHWCDNNECKELIAHFFGCNLHVSEEFTCFRKFNVSEKYWNLLLSSTLKNSPHEWYMFVSYEGKDSLKWMRGS